MQVDYLEYSEVWARPEKDTVLEKSRSFCLGPSVCVCVLVCV